MKTTIFSVLLLSISFNLHAKSCAYATVTNCESKSDSAKRASFIFIATLDEENNSCPTFPAAINPRIAKYINQNMPAWRDCSLGKAYQQDVITIGPFHDAMDAFPDYKRLKSECKNSDATDACNYTESNVVDLPTYGF